MLLYAFSLGFRHQKVICSSTTSVHIIGSEPDACRKTEWGHLNSDPVLVQSQDLSHSEGVELREQDRDGGAVAGEGLVGDEGIRDILCAQLDGRLAGGQRIRLREKVAHQLVVVGHHLTLRSTTL